jgi:Flp pilus assembly protein CpaB
MKTMPILFLLAVMACHTQTSSYVNGVPRELISDKTVKVAVAVRDLPRGTILRASDISFQELPESDAPHGIPKDISKELIGHKTVIPITKGGFVFMDAIDSMSPR